MKTDDILMYASQSQTVSVPQIQQRFGLAYGEVKTCVDKLVSDGRLRLVSDMDYEYVPKTPPQPKQAPQAQSKARQSETSYDVDEFIKNLRAKKEAAASRPKDEEREKTIAARRNLYCGLSHFRDICFSVVPCTEFTKIDIAKDFKDGVVFNGFRFTAEADCVHIDDDGNTMKLLAQKNVKAEKLRGVIEEIAKEYGARLENNVLRITVQNHQQSLFAYIKLYAVAERVSHLK